ncbi:PmbA/TldA family metallopeptidase [Streptomyces ipomoeae]
MRARTRRWTVAGCSGISRRSAILGTVTRWRSSGVSIRVVTDGRSGFGVRNARLCRC